MMHSTLQSLFGYKAWADVELFDTLATLPNEKFADQIYTCIRTLNHIYVVDRIFQAHLSELPRSYEATNTTETPSLPVLRQAVEATDAWYINYVASVTPANLAAVVSFTFTDADLGRMSKEEILLHVLTHGGYHRGNVGQVLKAIGIAPPRDLYTRFLHASEPGRREA